ncbi:heparan-alpha-glucosaminide N-acetyltransferase domain-containing protein [Streptomyces sp. H27-H1]|uniref:heparan-alpha-glucosaminide N-acetyltransferase domain-containing protein n=1 Tax=Streptomyces sp. H27-H1 TaxID=2996461 RepID=UPI00227091E1|nr:heparan-alpha-glucosaminide N-acetyltransferase domain-containing protein [Streptomyces sp. H27-H1]MCY0928513.1 heparan-alpha-glucosaminide N-acetyltransferase domain-containing protein [Streptomyces sp. H27-H1]
MGPNRLTGLDAARGTAVLGMFAVHVGPPPTPEGPGWLFVAADGRAPAVFTLIAGFSLALARSRTAGPPPLRTTLVRCAVLAALGLFLAAPSPGILVILAFYAVYFLAAEPFTRLRTRTLAAVAAASVVLGPVLSYLLGPALGLRAGGRGATPVPADLASWTGAGGMLRDLLLSGAYPLLTYFPYVLAGMALGRLADLRGKRSLRRLTGYGAALAIAGYGASWLALGPGGRRRAPLLQAVAREHPWAAADPDPVAAVLRQQFGAVPSTSWDWLLTAGPYSQTPLETIGNRGVGAALIGLLALAAHGAGRAAARLLRPLAAVGAMALTVYVVHALAPAVFMPGWSGWEVLAGFSASALIGCVLWRRPLRGTELYRGPLEWALRAATPAGRATG